MSAEQTPPGWYPDPQQPGASRYWDGTGWVDSPASQVHPAAASGVGSPASQGGTGRLPKWVIPVIACLGLAVVGLLIGLVAGEEEDQPQASDEPSAATATTDTTEAGGAAEEPSGPDTSGAGDGPGVADEVDDVTVSACSVDRGGRFRASVDVTNDTDADATYSIEVTFLGSGGETLATGIAVLDRLQPGETEGTLDVDSLAIPESLDFTCELSFVDRLPYQ